jgi:tetratricopeptide (TPR) repeat protein
MIGKRLWFAAIMTLSPPDGRAMAQSPDEPLIAAQQSVDTGRLAEAEAALRTYLAGHPGSPEAHALLGYVLLKENNPRASLDEYLSSAKYRQPLALDLVAMGSDYLLLEDFAKADAWLAKAYAADPDNSLTLYLWGRAAYNRQHFEEAASHFEQCLQLKPDNARALGQLGLAYQRLGKTDEAIAAYRRAITLSGSKSEDVPEDAATRIDLGSLLVETGKAEEAVPVLAEAARLIPADMRAHRELGKAYLRISELDKARVELESARRLDAENAPVHFLLSQVYNRLGRTEEARRESETYAALSKQGSAPDDPLREARGLAAAGDLRGSERLVRRYLETHRSSADAHYLLGYLLFRQKDAKASLAEYTEAARYRTPQAADLEAVAGDYVLLHDYPDAARWFAKAVEWDPNNFRIRYFLARALYNENRFEDAVHAFEECLKLDPKSVKAKDNQGLAYEGLGREEAAEAAYRTAIAWQSNAASKDSGPYANLGAYLVSVGRPGEAIPVLEEAIRIDPRLIAAHRELGKAYSHLDQFEKAQEELERTVALAPDAASPHYLLAQVYRRRGFADKAQAETEKYRALTATHSTDNAPSVDQAVRNK